MQTFHIYQPVAHGKPKIDKVDIFISLVPIGKENAIKRSVLVDKCVEAGIINASSKQENQDRAMRNLMRKAKVDYKVSITNDGDGKGYYRPTMKEMRSLDKNNKRMDKHAISTFGGSKVNKALAEDFKHERMGGDT